MRVCEATQKMLSRQPERGRDTSPKRPLLGEATPPPKVQIYQYQRQLRFIFIHRNHRQEKRAVNALSRVVYRGSPVAAEDAIGRRDVRAG